MSGDLILRICLEPPLLKSAQDGAHNFIDLVSNVAKNAGYQVELYPFSDVELSKPVEETVYTLTHMKQGPVKRGLVFRRVYYYPFWQIDQTAERWGWDVAQAEFDASLVPAAEAQKFAGFWKKRLFGAAPLNTSRKGMIYVPLQGRLSLHRSFQSCSPLEMLEHTIEHSAGRQIVATLHPKESYIAADLAALERLERRHQNLTVTMGDMETHLRQCDYVVTQNSSAAFAGYFFGKPALLFAKIDFHHIAVRADLANLASSFAKVAQANPAYDRYLWWFLQSQSINAGKDTASDKITARFARFGWPMK
jgi:hypothetical protein